MLLDVEEPQLSKKDSFRSNRIIVNYAVHTHPMTQLQSPDILDQEKNTVFEIMCQILYAALPLILCFELVILPPVINAYVVGNDAGPSMMAAVGLGTVLSNIFGFLIIQNLGVGFSVICSYFDDKQEIGFMYQKTLGINFFFCILVTPLLYLSDRFLLLIGFNKQIIEYSTSYVWGLIPSFYLFSFYDTTRNYLQSEGVIYPPLVIGTIGTILHYFLTSYFVISLDFGITGAAWALNVTNLFNSLVLYLYIVKKKPTKDSWIQWNICATNNVHKFLVQILIHEVSNYFQVLAFQILCIIACKLSQPEEIAAHFSLSFTIIMFYFIVMGVSNCLNRTLSLSIEDNEIKIGKKKIKLGLSFVLIFAFIIAINIFQQRNNFFTLFVNDTTVGSTMRGAFLIFLLTLLMDSVQIILFGILKTLQKNQLWKLPAICHYVVAMSTAIIFAYYFEWDLTGIWLGWFLGILISVVLEAYYLYKIDWSQKFAEVREKYKVLEENIRTSRMEISSYKII